MANNRLWLVSKSTGNKFLLAKGWTTGWAIIHDLDTISKWMTDNDEDAAYGTEHPTSLTLEIDQ